MGRIFSARRRRLSPSVSSFRAEFLALIPTTDLNSSFILPVRVRPSSVPPTQTASILSNIQPVRRPGEGKRLTMQSADRDRPTDRSARSPVRPSGRPPLSSHQHFESREITFLSSVHLTPRRRRRCRSTLTRPSPTLSFQWCKTLRRRRRRRRRWSVKSNFVKQDEPRRGGGGRPPARPLPALQPTRHQSILGEYEWACGSGDGGAGGRRRTRSFQRVRREGESKEDVR